MITVHISTGGHLFATVVLGSFMGRIPNVWPLGTTSACGTSPTPLLADRLHLSIVHRGMIMH